MRVIVYNRLFYPLIRDLDALNGLPVQTSVQIVNLKVNMLNKKVNYEAKVSLQSYLQTCWTYCTKKVVRFYPLCLQGPWTLMFIMVLYSYEIWSKLQIIISAPILWVYIFFFSWICLMPLRANILIWLSQPHTFYCEIRSPIHLLFKPGLPKS